MRTTAWSGSDSCARLFSARSFNAAGDMVGQRSGVIGQRWKRKRLAVWRLAGHSGGMDQHAKLERLERLVIYLALEMVNLSHASSWLNALLTVRLHPAHEEDEKAAQDLVAQETGKRMEKLLELLEEVGLLETYSKMFDSTHGKFP